MRKLKYDKNCPLPMPNCTLGGRWALLPGPLMAGMASLAVLMTLLLVPVLMGAATSQASDLGFNFRLTERLPAGDPAKLEIIPSIDLESLKVDLERTDGKRFSFSATSLRAGQSRAFTWQQEVGQFRYRARLTAGIKGASEPGVVEVEFSILCRKPVQVSVDRRETEVKEGKIVLSANRNIAKIEAEVFDGAGSLITRQEVTRGIGFGSTGPAELRWDQPQDREAKRVNLKVYDAEGFWGSVALLPFWVEIPHETVVFDTGRWEVLPREEHKLRDSLSQIREEMAKHGDELQIQLFVAGYTDTVGAAASNMTLSFNRARAIAQWFRKAGLKIPIWYQGFGQEVLAVQTSDNTPEERNRRALYILGDTAPPTSSQIPRRDWRRLR